MTGVADSDEAALEAFARRDGTTVFHPVGSAKMGLPSDPLAVVNARLKLIGLDGLRVIDASVMPAITSGNTNAPTMMIAEKGARDDPGGSEFDPIADRAWLGLAGGLSGAQSDLYPAVLFDDAARRDVVRVDGGEQSLQAGTPSLRECLRHGGRGVAAPLVSTARRCSRDGPGNNPAARRCRSASAG